MEQARIMIVEDEGIVAWHLAQRLQEMGHTVPAVLASGSEAVQHARIIRPDLVLMDIHLFGEMDGIEAATRIRAQEDIPVVYLTAYADETTLERAKITEPFGYVLKPFEDRELQATIEMALFKHRMEKALNQQRAEFLAMLTHDIKNPLSVILGYTEMLAQEVKASGLTRAGEIFGMLKSNVLTVHSLVANYLYLSTREAGHLHLVRKPIAINDVLHRVGQRYAAEAQRRSHQLEMQLVDDLPLLYANPEALERVFANLLDNAMKFMTTPGAVILGSALCGGEIVASVTDTGPGIPEDQLSVVFEKYQRAPRDQFRSGSGLGLFIVRELVKEHGGQVEVTSTIGEGTCFTVRLPAAPADQPVSLSKYGP
jgi:signal transduction histidine kinase